MKKKSKRYRGVFVVTFVLGILLSLLLGIYVAGVRHFREHFLPGTKIGGIACGNQTPAYIVDRNIRDAEEYLLAIYARDTEKVNLVGKDFGYRYVSYGAEQEVLAGQNPYSWPLAFFRESEYELPRKVIFDKATLKALVLALPMFTGEQVRAPKNAYVRLTGDGYEVVAEENGNTPDPVKVTELVTQQVENMVDNITITEDCYLTAEICSDDPSITEFTDKIESYLNASIHYEIDGVDENLTRASIAKLLSITNSGELKLDDAKITAYVQSLASKYNTYADEREFRTTNGDTITIGGGDYGWVIDKAAEKKQIMADLAGGVPVSREPVYEQRAAKSGLDDIGDTYIELDYTKQHFWYYKSGSLFMESDLVSGNLSTKNGSVDGVYKIVYKKADAELVGENYASKVKYFMPFAYNIGFHDASWRSDFGGQIYKTSGSHGCINLPEDVAERLFNNVAVGTPVVAYYRESVTLTNNAAKISNAYSYKK